MFDRKLFLSFFHVSPKHGDRISTYGYGYGYGSSGLRILSPKPSQPPDLVLCLGRGRRESGGNQPILAWLQLFWLCSSSFRFIISLGLFTYYDSCSDHHSRSTVNCCRGAPLRLALDFEHPPTRLRTDGIQFHQAPIQLITATSAIDTHRSSDHCCVKLVAIVIDFHRNG